MMPIAAVVFDLDGTLVDSRADIARAANFALSHHGFQTHPAPEIGKFVGDGARSLMLRAAALEPDSPLVQPLLDTYLEYYARHVCVETTPMPGALDALDALRDLPLAVLTNKPRQTAVSLLDELGLLERFCLVVGGGDCAKLKPDPMPLLGIAARIGVPSQTLVMVGDGPQDVECGRRAGAFTIGVAGGIADWSQLLASKPDRLIETLHQLDQVLRGIASS